MVSAELVMVHNSRILTSVGYPYPRKFSLYHDNCFKTPTDTMPLNGTLVSAISFDIEACCQSFHGTRIIWKIWNTIDNV